MSVLDPTSFEKLSAKPLRRHRLELFGQPPNSFQTKQWSGTGQADEEAEVPVLKRWTGNTFLTMGIEAGTERIAHNVRQR
jgi:hypothetical protein